MDRRIGALEELVEQRVEEELRAVFELLEERLSREEFVRVARIIASLGEEDDLGGGSRWGA